MYRPEGWKNPYAVLRGQPHNNFTSYNSDAYEEGASAMLEALRTAHGCYINDDDVACVRFPLGKAKGYFVFILDEEVMPEEL